MKQHAKKLSVSSGVPLARVLARTSQELETLAGMSVQIQCLISRLTLEVAPADTTYMRDIQRLDQMAQSIAGIATFLDALAEGAPADCELDAVAAAHRVKLSDLAARLSFTSVPRPAARHDSNGECVFFD